MTARLASASTGAEETEDWWRLRVFAPIPALAGPVRALTWYQEDWPGPMSRRQVATGGAVVFLTWGAPLETEFVALRVGHDDPPSGGRLAAVVDHL